uniref:Uncharacterized protein n=1 Tax=viral metagenome TaxID=1070528 RepID=A0A6C0EBM6_9ZZZZ
MLFNLPNSPIKQLTTNLNPSTDTTIDTTMDTTMDKVAHQKINPYTVYDHSLLDSVVKFATKHTITNCLYLALINCRNIYWDDLSSYATDECHEKRTVFFSFDKYLFMKTFKPMDRSDD